MIHTSLLKHATLAGDIRLYCGRLGRMPMVAPYTDNPQAGWMHFFLADFRFEAVWTNPLRYARRWLNLPDEGLAGFVGFDFSCFDDWPDQVNAWNCYRSALLTDFLGRLLEKPVLPVASWWNEGDNFGYLEFGTAVAVGSYPLKQGDRAVYLSGLGRMLDTVKPCEIHVFGNLPPAGNLRGLPAHRYDLHYQKLNRQQAGA